MQSKRNSAPVSFNNDKGLRRLSLAAGTIEIPYTIPHTIRRKSKVPSKVRLIHFTCIIFDFDLKLKRKVEPRSPIQFPESFNSLILNSSHESSVSFSQYWNTLYAVETAIEPPANASDEELYHQAPNKLFTIDHKTRKSMDEIDRK